VKKVNRKPKKPINSSRSKHAWHTVIELHSNGCITDGKQRLFVTNKKWNVSEYSSMDNLLENAASNFCVLRHAITLQQ
jgi:hypothetical protein